MAGFFTGIQHNELPESTLRHPTVMQHYALWYGTVPALTKALNRSERSVKDWLAGKSKVPRWAPEIMRLQKMENDAMVYRMTGRSVTTRLNIAGPAGELIDAGARFKPAPPPLIDTSAVTPTGAAIARLYCLTICLSLYSMPMHVSKNFTFGSNDGITLVVTSPGFIGSLHKFAKWSPPLHTFATCMQISPRLALVFFITHCILFLPVG